MSNGATRNGAAGTAASASSESYRGRRTGNLGRASDGFRSPSPPTEPRRPATGSRKADEALAPYHYNPASPAESMRPVVPRTWYALRIATPGAPTVGLPDQQRTSGHLQPSGRAWGAWGPGAPAFPTSHLRWRRPSAPRVYER